MKISRVQTINLKHGKEYRLGYHGGFIADENYDFRRCDFLMWNSKRFRFERRDVFEKLPAIFEPSFMIFKDHLGVIKFDGDYTLKLFSEGNIEIK